MTLQEYRQRYADIYHKIQTAQSKLDSELAATQTAFDRLYQRQQEIDKRWFVANLSFFLKHKKHFTSDFGLSQIIVDFLLPIRNAGMVAGFAWNSSSDYKIYLKDLLSLWDNGFCYEENPIISYQVITHYGKKITIEFVKNGRIESIKREYKEGKNPLELPEELLKKVRQADVSHKYIYQNWQTYKTIDVVRKVLDKKEPCDEVAEK